MVTKISTLVIGNTCPNCGSRQFSISCLPPGSMQEDFPPGVLGVGDCRDCQQDFLVKLAPELKHTIYEMLERNERELALQLKRAVIGTLFP